VPVFMVVPLRYERVLPLAPQATRRVGDLVKAVLILVLVLTNVSAYRNKVQQLIINSGNLSQLSITRKCQLQLEEFFSNFTLNQYSWALQSKYRRGKFCFYQFVRSGYATSKIPSGLWSLNFGEIEDFQQCINIAASSSTGEIFGKYCLGYLVAKNTSSAVHREVPSLHHCDCYLTVLF
jgi:hypothetical protein